MSKGDFASLWTNARKRYYEISGKDLGDIANLQTTDELLKRVESQNLQYKHFREKQSTLFSALNAAIKPIELVGNLAAGAASAAFPPSSMCFGAATYLINAAHGVSASLDAISDLLAALKDFTVRLKVYNQADLSQELREKLTEILITVIDIFGRSTKVIQDGVLSRLKAYGKNILTGNDKELQSLMARLDKLTLSEDRLVGAETLMTVKRTATVVENVRGSMGEATRKLSNLAFTTDQVSTGVGQILGAVEESKAQAIVDKDLKHLEAVKKLLKPSVLAQDRFDEIKREHVPGSGNWIRLERPLQDWVDSRSPILWISGNPGSGKSFLTYSIISHLHEQHQDANSTSASTSVGYFFFKDNDAQTRSFEQALRDISYQICQTNQVYAKYVANVSHTSPEVSSIRSAWQKLFVDYFIVFPTESSAFIIFDGVDESSSDDRIIFFELLEDLQKAGSRAKLHVAMLGRPQIIEEIADELGDRVPAVQVDWSKNGSDIARYVELSITKSRVLSRVSKPLKQLIIQTLTSKANGMFMWVKLMIVELSKKSRESAIKEALNAAPKGLTEMLRHVLETFSRTLSEDEAADLNEMLCWIALAKRPLALGELDAIFRLKSPEGEGILYLEGKLRKQFASFFTLTREDTLTTADLQAPRKSLEEDEITSAGPDAEEGLDNVENETDFDSNISTTTIAFSHASIGDFFRDNKEGKVIAPDGEHPAVGLNLKEARFHVARTCIDLMSDATLGPRMKEAVSFTTYAGQHWRLHLLDLNKEDTSDEEKIGLGVSLSQMFQEQQSISLWAWAPNFTYYTDESAKQVLHWMADREVLEKLSEEPVRWIESVTGNPVEVFASAMRYTATAWLVPDKIKSLLKGTSWIEVNCAQIIFCYNKRRMGTIVDKEQTLSEEDIRATAEWAGFEKTADWHRRVAKVLRENKWYEAAIDEFNRALELDSKLWTARGGIATALYQQEKYREALEQQQLTLKIVEQSEEVVPGSVDGGTLMWTYKQMGDCYAKFCDEIEAGGDWQEKERLLTLALKSYKQAFHYWNTGYAHLAGVIAILDPTWRQQMAKEFHCSNNNPKDPVVKQNGYEQIMELLHELDATPKGDTTNLIKWLQYGKNDRAELNKVIALAAKATKQVGWLQEQYRAAITNANKLRQPVTSAYMALRLARLNAQYGDDEEKALRIWEAIGSEPVTSVALATEIGYVRRLALDELGRLCIRKALEDESKAGRYVRKMERITSKRRYGGRIGIENSVPLNDVALYLAAWYHKFGRDEDAREAVKGHIRDALVVLSDDDQTNDIDGYWNLVKALLLVGDEANALAVYHSVRPYENGQAVIANESKPQKTKTGVGKPDDGDDDDDELVPAWSCEGICGNAFDNCEDMRVCRYCNLEFCKDCHKLLVDKELPLRICGRDHSFLTVPTLTTEQRFSEGELLVNGTPVPTETWKANLRKQYNL